MSFNFYVPFINNTYAVEQYIAINNQMKKGKIKGVYADIPFVEFPTEGFPEGFLDNAKKLQENGIEVILNLEFSNKVHLKWFAYYEVGLSLLIEAWMKEGFRSVLLTNTHIMRYLSELFPSLHIMGSYKQNLNSMKQYINLSCKIHNLTAISPSCFTNHNLHYLKNLNNFFHFNVQIVVNNGCRPNCFKTYNHQSWLDAKKFENILEENYGRWTDFFTQCFDDYAKDFWRNLVMSDIIYPWQLEEMEMETGISDFRLLPPKAAGEVSDNETLNFIAFYLSVLENYEEHKNFPFSFLNSYLVNKINTNISLDFIKQYIPSLAFFNQHKVGSCRDVCGIDCNKCKNIANQIEIALQKNNLF